MTDTLDHVPAPYSAPPFAPIKLNNLMVKIADSKEEIAASQRLRYQIFCGEIGAKASPEMQKFQRDFDAYDAVCDHLLVLHQPEGHEAEVVGTYRLLRTEPMQEIGAFYSEQEFDIAPLKKHGGNLMELGRSCVHNDFRNRAVMQLLWRGIGEYVTHYHIDFMFGCASFAGCDIEEHAECLSYLHHFHHAPKEYCPRALPELYKDMNQMEKDTIDQKRAFLALPVLLKGYLRLGGVIGDGAMLDHNYNTTDVSVVVKTDKVGAKYVSKYAPEQDEKADKPWAS